VVHTVFIEMPGSLCYLFILFGYQHVSFLCACDNLIYREITRYNHGLAKSVRCLLRVTWNGGLVNSIIIGLVAKSADCKTQVFVQQRVKTQLDGRLDGLLVVVVLGIVMAKSDDDFVVMAASASFFVH